MTAPIIRLVAIGSFENNEILTRALRQVFYVDHETDTAIDDTLQSRLLTIKLNGRPPDDGKVWLELVQSVKESVKAEYEFEIQQLRGQFEELQAQLADAQRRIEEATR